MYRLPFSIKACQRAWQPWGDVNGSGVQNPLIIKKKPEWRTASLSARVWTNSVLIAFGDTTTWFWRRLNWNAFPKTVCSVETRWNYGCGEALMSRALKKIVFTGRNTGKIQQLQRGFKLVVQRWCVRAQPYLTTGSENNDLMIQAQCGKQEVSIFFPVWNVHS